MIADQSWLKQGVSGAIEDEMEPERKKGSYLAHL
jgi:hypothetical protein